MHPLQDEAQWAPLSRDGSVEYTRPLLGSELMNDQFSQCFNGIAQCCMGFTFETSLPFTEFCSLIQSGWAHLRFRCPTVGARLENIHDHQLRSWVYKPALGADEVRDWVKRTIVILEEPIGVEDFICHTNQQKLEDLPDKPIIRCMIFAIPDRKDLYGVFLHGSHTIMDARPTFQAFQIMCEEMTKSNPIENLPWGTEWKNLPDGPVTATGGPRDNWESSGVDLLSKAAAVRSIQPVTRSLRPPQKKNITSPGLPVRVHAVINASDSREVLKAVKATGCSMNNLIEAAQALAICKVNPVPDEEKEGAQISFPFTVFSLAKWLTEEQKSKDRIISSLATVPIRINYADIAAPVTPRERLVNIMQSLKKQYDVFMENPHLPHLTAAEMTLYPPRQIPLTANPFATTITNLGVIEQFTKSEWYPGGDSTKEPIFKVCEMSFGHRLTEPNPFGHAWSMNSEIHLQVQGADIWDREYLQSFVDEIRRHAMDILT